MAKHRAKPKRKKKVSYYSPKRRVMYENGDDIDHLVLFMLHGWTCSICKEQINPRLRFPNYMAATVEHEVPLSKGGKHVWNNCYPAHAKCNFEKSDSLPEHISGNLDV